MKAMSLFANIGVAEAYLKDIGIDVVLANEIDPKRATVYSHLYPETEMICGDITKESVQQELIQKAKAYKVDILMATPPCQGMSTAGKQEKNDSRNSLIKYAVLMVQKLLPKYVFFENVPLQLVTEIKHNGKQITIPEYIKEELEKNYIIKRDTINVCDYGVAQTRERAVFLLTKRNETFIWEFPKKDKKIRTLQDEIGHLPILDPFVKDISQEKRMQLFPCYEENKKLAESYSKWHTPPVHVYRQVITMMHTPTGKSAFDNEKYIPMKSDGTPVKGYKNTYKRQNWNLPGYTITMYNRTISSQNNVHPGREMGRNKEGEMLYSDPRVLTLYELMLVMSLPPDWPLPDNVSESFLRSVIGEGVPPLFVKKVFLKLNIEETYHEN